mgnify:CR=1 FL=1
MSYVVTSGATFNSKLKECAVWLMEHYDSDYGEEYAEIKIKELHNEISELVSRIKKMPRIYEAVKNSKPEETRAHSVHNGRYLVVWEIHETSKTVILTNFMDLKYPIDPRFSEFEFDE